MIKNIVENNDEISIDSIHKQKLSDILSTFRDSNNNFDLENFIKYLNDENVKVIREGYSLNFLGKRAAELQSALDSTTVFVPDKEHNSKPENKDSENIYISADNLEALRHLKKSYHNKIKCIYIDPPYNTGNDGFCYSDKFKYDKDELATKLGINVSETERILNMESTKSNSHSAWLSFMYARLLIARELLVEDGVIFISIDDNEQSNLKLLCDEIFGEEQFVSQLVWQNKEGGGKSDSKFFRQKHEYILVYAKNTDKLIIKPLPVEDEDRYKLSDKYEATRGKYQLIKLDSGSLGWVKSLDYPIEYKGHTFYAGGSKEKWEERQNGGNAIKDWGWRWSKEKLKWGIENDFIEIKESNGIWNIYTKQYFNCDKDGNIIDGRKIQPIAVIDEFSTTQANKELKSIFGSAVFSYSKPKELIKYIFSLCIDKNDIILDFFSGSATTAQAVLEYNVEQKLNLKYILIQIPEDFNFGKFKTISDIGIERIKRAAKKIKDETNADIDYGFKHYTLVDKKDTLDTLEKFDSNFAVLTQDEILKEFTIESRLITFLCDDGFGLNAKYEEIDIAGFKGYLIDGFLYLLDIGFDSLQIASLIEKVDKKEIALRKIVIFGYAFDTRSLQQLKDNAEKMGLNDNKDIIVKY